MVYGLDSVETQIISVPESVLLLRLWKIQWESWKWDSEDYSLGFSLEIETERIPVSVSVLKVQTLDNSTIHFRKV